MRVYNQRVMTREPENELYICVDVETAGPIPGDYSLLSIGACTLDDQPQTFYIELKPENANFTPEAADVHHLSMERLQAEGIPPREALRRFEEWIAAQASPGMQPLFVAFNAAFDWMFVNYYFLHYLGHNPFGHAAIDIKAFYMGLSGKRWAHTSWRFIDPVYKKEHSLTHHALQDALDQAFMFKKMLEDHQNKK